MAKKLTYFHWYQNGWQDLPFEAVSSYSDTVYVNFDFTLADDEQ